MKNGVFVRGGAILHFSGKQTCKRRVDFKTPIDIHRSGAMRVWWVGGDMHLTPRWGGGNLPLVSAVSACPQ